MPALSAFGRHWGRAELIEQARLADKNPPRLDGDVVEFHPAYHRFMADSMAAGLHAMTWRADATAGGRAGRGRARGALFHGGAGGERPHVPDHHDARLGGGAGGRARARRQGDAEDRLAQLRPELSARGGRNPP